MIDVAGENGHDLARLSKVVVRRLHGDEGARGVHPQVVLNVVAERLPSIFGDSLTDSETEETKEDEDTIADGRVAVERGDHVLNNLWT